LLAHAPDAALPWLGAAAALLLLELPDARTGLRPAEHRILQALAASEQPIFALYEPARASQPLRGLTDESFLRLVAALAEGPDPLVQPGRRAFRDPIRLTPRGSRALGGEGWDPPERWVLGVHLGPGQPRWRWDGQRRAPIL